MTLPQLTKVLDADYYHALHAAAQGIIEMIRLSNGNYGMDAAQQQTLLAYIERLEYVARLIGCVNMPDRGDMTLARLIIGLPPLPPRVLPVDDGVSLAERDVLIDGDREDESL